jgi:hypothetical protein
MHLDCERCASQRIPTELNHKDLYDDCNGHDQEEHVVVEEAAEHIELMLLQLSAVDLVENLEEYEGMEENCEVESFVHRPVSMMPARSQIEDCREYKEDD